MGTSVEITPFTWELTTRPPNIQGLRPTAHFEIDSRKVPPALLTEIEDILYGNLASDPRMPAASELVDMFKTYVPPVPQPETEPVQPKAPIIDAGTTNTTVTSTYDGGSPTSTPTTTYDGGTP